MLEPRLYRYQARVAATQIGGGSGTGFCVPCKGARYVVIRFKSTDATDTLSAASCNVGFDPVGMLNVANPASSGLFSLQSGTPVTGSRLDRVDGLPLVIYGPLGQQNSRILINYVQPTWTAAGTSPTNDITGFEVTVDVYYDDGADQLYGQTLTVV